MWRVSRLSRPCHFSSWSSYLSLASDCVRSSAREQLAVVERLRRQRRGRRARQQRLPVQPPAQRLEHDAPGGEAAVARVRALDHDPRRVRGAGLAQRALAHLVEPVVQLVVLPVALGDAPARLRVLLQRLQALLLALFREMEPELEHQRALVGEHLLEAHVLFHRLVERGVAGLAVGARENRERIPRAEEDAGLSLGRQVAPEMPHRRMLALFLGRLAQRVGGDVARIHPLLQQVDGLALAGAVHAVDEDEQGEFGAVQQLVLRLKQRLAQPGKLAFVDVLLDRMAKLGGFEHAGRPRWFPGTLADRPGGNNGRKREAGRAARAAGIRPARRSCPAGSSRMPNDCGWIRNSRIPRYSHQCDCRGSAPRPRRAPCPRRISDCRRRVR